MTFHILTIFPELFEPYLQESVIGRGTKRGSIKVKIYDLRKFTEDKHRKVDDKPYGGGPGMVMGIQPLTSALEHIVRGKPKSATRIILTAPGGRQFSAGLAVRLARKYKHLVIVAGRYEGFDERVKQVVRSGMGLGVDTLSVGPYVLTGGELPALVIVDAVARYIKGVLGKTESLESKRYGVGVPAYTRPEVFEYRGRRYRVPKVLTSGRHSDIDEWRRRRGKTFN